MFGRRVFAVAVLLPGLASAVLKDCAALPETRTGIPLDGCTIFSASTCDIELRYECDTMYDFLLYSPAAIPCGFASAESCAPDVNISFPHPDYTPEALEAAAGAVAAMLPPGEPLINETDAGGDFNLLFPNVEMTELYLSEPTQINMTFVGEGGCQRNSLGMTILPGTVNPRDITLEERVALLQDTLEFSVIFPNVDFRFCQCDDPLTPSSYDDFCTETKPPLTRGATMRLKPDFRADPDNYVFPADVYVTFFLLVDGFDAGFSPGNIYLGPAESILFATPELNDPDFSVKAQPNDFSQHAVVFRLPEVEVDGEVVDFSDAIWFAFEDRRRFEQDPSLPSSDLDFEDVTFFVQTDVDLTFGMPSAAPTDFGGFFGAPTVPPTPSDFCAAGLLSVCGNVCCDASCGGCGGCNCALLPGGADSCCPSAILFTGIDCVSSTDVACIVDADLICSEDGIGCD